MECVHLDNYGGAYDVTSYLLESGHRQIGLLSGGDEWPSGVYRKRGFIQALKDWGIPFDQRLVYNGHFTQFGGYLGAKSLLETNPSLSAIFAVSDEMALGAIRALYDLGLKVPDDVSVVGFDGIWAKPRSALNYGGNRSLCCGNQCLRHAPGDARVP